MGAKRFESMGKAKRFNREHDNINDYKPISLVGMKEKETGYLREKLNSGLLNEILTVIKGESNSGFKIVERHLKNVNSKK